MITLERASHNKPVGWKSLIGILIVPLIVALGFLGATWNADHRLIRAQAAVVNLDEMVELNGQPAPLGRQLAAGLVERRDDNLSWELADAAHAKSGLESGRYVAVVTIPKEFSADATSFAGNAAQARQATIKVETSQVTGIADGAIAQVIAETARGVFNTTLTETYLDNVYLGFNETGKQFRTVADAAGKLADGGNQLADGMRSSADGTADLATGSRSYATGVRQAATGADQLATGAEQLAAGGGQLATGADGLATGAGQLAGGVGQLGDGLGRLADGSQGIADGSQRLADGTAALAPGVHAYVDGVDQLVAGIEPVLGLLGQVDTSQLDPAQLQAAADRLATIQSEAKAYAQRLDAIANTPCPTPQGVEFTPEQRAAFCAEWDRTTAALTAATPETGGKSPVAWAKDIAASPQLTEGLSTLRTLLPQLPELANGAGRIGELRTGGAQIAAGVDGLAQGTAQLNTGIQTFNTGLGQAAAGVPQLADGAGQLADGAGQFATGVGQYTDGVSQVATGTRGLATGMSSLADGADNLATGTENLAGGLDRAATGGRELADGQRQLADGLAEGATKVPTYSDADRQALKTAVAQPVAAGQQVPDLIPAASSTSLLMVLALWLGGLATYLVIQAISSRTLTSTRSTFELVRRALVPGLGIAAVQAIALTILGQVVLGLPAAKVVGVLGMLLLGGAMFVVVNHALVSWFGGLGRLVSVTMVTLVAAGGLLSALPAFFDAVLPAMPLTPVLHGIRAIITDGSGVTGAVAMTVLWLIVGLAASVGAVLRRRTVSPQSYARLIPRKFAAQPS